MNKGGNIRKAFRINRKPPGRDEQAQRQPGKLPFVSSHPKRIAKLKHAIAQTPKLFAFQHTTHTGGPLRASPRRPKRRTGQMKTHIHSNRCPFENSPFWKIGFFKGHHGGMIKYKESLRAEVEAARCDSDTKQIKRIFRAECLIDTKPLNHRKQALRKKIIGGETELL